LPRIAATSSGRRRLFSPFTVALRRFTGFGLPRLFARMSRMPRQLEDGADAAAGDDAGSLARRAQEHAGASSDRDLVRDRHPALRHLEEVLLRVVDGLRDGERDLPRAFP
jgi:hypothetical protein